MLQKKQKQDVLKLKDGWMTQPYKLEYAMSQREIAEKMFLNAKTVMHIEKRAMEKFKILLEERGINLSDLLESK